jgi:hypothetical protein
MFDYKRFVSILVFLLLAMLTPQFNVMAIELPVLTPLKDSIFLGERIKVVFSFRHDKNMELLFPDSNYNYKPFEFISKTYYPTLSDSIQSRDSVVYTLATYEFEPRLSLALPVFIFQSGDTSMLYSNSVDFNMREVITPSSPPDSLRVNTLYRNLSTNFNYPYLIIGFGTLFVIGAILFLFFRKRILAQYLLYRMKKDFAKFDKKYTQLSEEYNLQTSSKLLEDMLSLWKKYLEKLEKIPYTTLTTKEISKLIDINQLTSSLQNFDRVIYGGYASGDMNSSISFLKEMADMKYKQKQKEVSNV